VGIPTPRAEVFSRLPRRTIPHCRARPLPFSLSLSLSVTLTLFSPAHAVLALVLHVVLVRGWSPAVRCLPIGWRAWLVFAAATASGAPGNIGDDQYNARRGFPGGKATRRRRRTTSPASTSAGGGRTRSTYDVTPGPARASEALCGADYYWGRQQRQSRPIAAALQACLVSCLRCHSLPNFSA
jgi:hypothetical protein